MNDLITSRLGTDNRKLKNVEKSNSLVQRNRSRNATVINTTEINNSSNNEVFKVKINNNLSINDNNNNNNNSKIDHIRRDDMNITGSKRGVDPDINRAFLSRKVIKVAYVDEEIFGTKVCYSAVNLESIINPISK
eukprot:Pgem_evm1s12872